MHRHARFSIVTPGNFGATIPAIILIPAFVHPTLSAFRFLSALANSARHRDDDAALACSSFIPKSVARLATLARSSKFRRLSASSRDDDAPRGRTGLDAEAGFDLVGVVVDVDGGTAARARPGGANDRGGWRKLASRADVHQGGVVRDLQARAVGDGRLDGRWSESERSRVPRSAMMSARRLLHAEMNARSDAGSRARMS